MHCPFVRWTCCSLQPAGNWWVFSDDVTIGHSSSCLHDNCKWATSGQLVVSRFLTLSSSHYDYCDDYSYDYSDDYCHFLRLLRSQGNVTLIPLTDEGDEWRSEKTIRLRRRRRRRARRVQRVRETRTSCSAITSVIQCLQWPTRCTVSVPNGRSPKRDHFSCESEFITRVKGDR